MAKMMPIKIQKCVGS